MMDTSGTIDDHSHAFIIKLCTETTGESTKKIVLAVGGMYMYGCMYVDT